MKKKILSILLSTLLIFSLFAIGVCATGEELSDVADELNSGDTIGIIGGADGETDILLSDDIFYDDEFYDEYGSVDSSLYPADSEELFSMMEQIGEENMGVIMVAAVILVICSLLFLPMLVLLIVFAVLNSKLKKQIAELENKERMSFNPNQGFNPNYNVNPVTNYAQPVNPVEPQQGGDAQ
ncbi:MAG: hypothetical protein IIX14_00505 [Clostridia bacterium]|nr:hypothetical protein [Clostridia bacterium]